MQSVLRQGGERFSQIAERVRKVFWMAAVDFSQMFYLSPSYEEIWGRTCGSVYQNPHSWMAAIHPDDQSRVGRVLETDRSMGFEIEYRIVRPDGLIRWIVDRGFPIRDDRGQLSRIAGIAEDITERKRVDEQLRTSERLLAEAQRLAHIGSWHWNLTTRNVTWSDELFRIFGVEPDEIEPRRDAMAFVHADERDAVTAAVNGTLQTKEPYNIVYGIRRSGWQHHPGQSGLESYLGRGDQGRARGRLTLTIEDDGRGMAPGFVEQVIAGVGALGVGLAGMRERLKQIGGALEIHSSARGTMLRALVPAGAGCSR